MPVDTPEELLNARGRVAEYMLRRGRLVASPLDPAGRRQLAELDAQVGELLDRLRHRIDPCDASPEVPLVLLPVRVQTKMKPGTSTLRVRITPDELHLDSLVRSTTADEIAAGQAYWATRWTRPEDPGAWSLLVDTVGARRAGWVAHVTTPTNLAEFGTGSPAFPAAPEEITGGTVARCLPDQFVVRVFPAGGAPVTAVGAPIARDVPISPIALGDDDVTDLALGPDGDDDAAVLRVPAGSEWTVDYERAKAAGLGVDVELPGGTTLLDRVVVVGTRNSASEAENAADLTELLTSHRFSDGFALLPPGTPTNNADAERSPYSPDATVGAPASTTPAPSADSSALAAHLGIDAVALEKLRDSTAPRSSLDAVQQAANTALWFATFEPVLKKIDDADLPEVNPGTIEAGRRVHRDFVRGAGHTPAMRIGAQPYGVLPVTNLGSWVPRRGDLTAALEPLIERTLTRWVARSRTLPRVGMGDSVSDEAMLELLGTSPVSTSVRARPAVDGQQLTTLGKATNAAGDRVLAEIRLSRSILAQYSVSAAKWLTPPSLHAESRSIALPLVSERDGAVIAEILAEGAPRVDSVLQALLDVAWDDAKRAVFRATPKTHVPPLLDLLELPPDIAELVTSVVEERPIVDPGRPSRLRAAAEQLRGTVHFEGQPVEALSISAIEPIAEARTSLGQVALDLGVTPEAKWIGQNAVADLLGAFATRWEVEAAMTALGDAPLEERRIAVASALDVASHRVDAWATALAVSRQRSLPAGEGATIGAFGYVEGVRLGSTAEPQGWLQAPSSSHAVAAGVLASAHLSNIGAKPGRQPFAIDLSSRRGAELRRVLEGIHAGRPLGALLGYQIERGLTGSAARFQLSLRELAPLNTDELNNDLAEEDRTARVAAADVVDGAELLRRFPVESLAGASPPLRALLEVRPQNAYVEEWSPVSPEEWNTVVRALTVAAETLDAVSDALLSEAVLQYASGNPERASVAMDAMSSGAAVDPDLGVLSVRQAGQTLSHGMFAAIPADARGWSTTRPRALAEPRLEAWAARRLGDPRDIVVTDGPDGRHTLDEAGFAALDLVFADDLASLERELRAAIPSMGDAPLARRRSADWPSGARPIEAVGTSVASALRTLIAGATPLGPDGVVRPGATIQRRFDTEELLDRCDALLDALERVLGDGADLISGIDPESYAIGEDQVDDVRDAVRGLAAFGVPLVPDPKIPTNAGWAVGAWYAAAARLDDARTVIADARAPHDPPYQPSRILDLATSVVEGVLGDGFRILPLLTPPAAGSGDDFVEALERSAFPAPQPSAVSGFVRDHATVRAGVARLAEAQLLGRATGNPIGLTVAQLTERDDDGEPAAGTNRWLAGALPDDIPWPAHSASHLIVELVGAPAEFRGAFAGLAIDGWTEALPYQPHPRALGPGSDPGDPLRAARATTGLAVHAHQSSARAPQVVLSAVSPDGKRWTTDSVVQAVLSAVDVSKARLVTFEHVPGDAAILPAIYVASPWLQPRKGFSFGELAEVQWDKVAYRFLSEVE